METTMETLLLELLYRLESLGKVHGELYDSGAREQIGGLIMDGFVHNKPDYVMPHRLGMLSEDADLELRQSLTSYIEGANKLSAQIGLSSFHERLAAFQNPAVRTNQDIAIDYEEIFGHTPPEWYDEAGNILWDRVR
ncbi:hypothetical protein [Singulisphaera sp. PoT]|uniref:hypothetical protein n=1 Tax=Singulisphaera sp. PoT TaxID=3411797 RepID=UPI003BF614AD